MSGWVDVLGSAELSEGGRCTVDVGGKAVALVRVEGRVWAVDDTCPHRGGPMGQGDLQGHFLYCPLHAWSFDVRDGTAFFPKGARLACFAVKEEAGRVWVQR